jgi:hypothetical protein
MASYPRMALSIMHRISTNAGVEVPTNLYPPRRH